MAIQRALLLIADIGGYTRYMKVHRINLAHAQDIVARLLEAVIDGATPKLKLSKLEGDAAFFYGVIPERDRNDLTDVTQQVASIRRAFLHRRAQMEIDRLCTCDGCTQLGSLKLKFVAHIGDVAFQKVKSFTELAGVDVIIVHRMLKNTVPVAEYALFTEPVLGGISDAIRVHAKPVDEELEGIGAMRMHYVDLDEIEQALPSELVRSRWRALWEHIMLNLRSIPYILGFRKSCDGFRNMDEARGLPSTPSMLPESRATSE